MRYSIRVMSLITIVGLSLFALHGCRGQSGSYVVLVTATPRGGQADLPAAEGSADDGEVAPANRPTVLPENAPTPTFIPTPNPTRAAVPTIDEDITHIVQFGDTLAIIGAQYGVSVNTIVEANNLVNPNILAVGQTLIIPQSIVATGPAFKVLPDSEIIYGPSVEGFSVERYLRGSNSFLARYEEELNGRMWSGAEIIERVALEQSLNPRLLLALLEYESQWLSRTNVDEQAALYPMNFTDRPTQIYGLYRQLDWSGKLIQSGYYGWKYRGLSVALLQDGQRVRLDATINPGTAAVQYALGQTKTLENWQVAVQHTGLFATYNFLFGDPFENDVSPLVPINLEQPPLDLPWTTDQTWYYTGGPHGGWGSGSPWAALDFVTNDQVQGCELPDEMAAAVADGTIARSEYGIVVLDLDGDGFEGTGWSIYYLHISSEDRPVREGQRVRVGDPIGYPSCEGGVSFASHLHIARRYNGEWLAADCSGCLTSINVPVFNMEGWITTAFNSEYNGSLTRGEAYREACVCRERFNTFTPSDR